MGKPSKKKEKPAPPVIGVRVPPTKEFMRQCGDDVAVISAITDGVRHGVYTNTVQIPIDYYRKKAQITNSQWEAGNRLFKDFSTSGQLQSITMNPDSSGNGKDYTDKQMEARLRWREAIDSVPGVIGKMLVTNICCYGYMVRDIEARYYRRPNEAMARFREALDDLAQGYGIPLDY